MLVLTRVHICAGGNDQFTTNKYVIAGHAIAFRQSAAAAGGAARAATMHHVTPTSLLERSHAPADTL